MSECRTCGTPSGALFTANAAGILKQCPTCNLMRPEHYFEQPELAPLAGKEAEPTPSEQFPVVESAQMPKNVMAMIGLNVVLTHVPTGQTKVFDTPMGIVAVAAEAHKFQDECEAAPVANRQAEAEPKKCRFCAEGIPLKEYFDGRMMHFDGLMCWTACTALRERALREDCDAVRHGMGYKMCPACCPELPHKFDDYRAEQSNEPEICALCGLDRKNEIHAPAMNTEAPLVGQPSDARLLRRKGEG